MKENKETLEKVESMLLNFLHIYTSGTIFDNKKMQIVYSSMYHENINARVLRACLQELRNTGRVNCLLACATGYFYADNTQNVVTYLKRLQKEATQLHRLYSSIKKQAELEFSSQIDIQFLDNE